MEPLVHPAGVTLPFEGPADAALIIPEIRSAIRSGEYSAEIIELLSEAVRPGDRVLVIGAGLGVVSTLVAKTQGVERVIAVEANTLLIPYLERVHEMNGVAWVETVNAVLTEGKKGRVPFFARRDIRTSSLLPHDLPWQQVMMVPFMDLELILAEEQITLIISEIPISAASPLATIDLHRVERILLAYDGEAALCWDERGLCTQLAQRGFVPEPGARAALFRRQSAPEAHDRAARDGERHAHELELVHPERGEDASGDVETADHAADDAAGDLSEGMPSGPEPGGPSVPPDAPPTAGAARAPEAGSAPAAGVGKGERRRRRRRGARRAQSARAALGGGGVGEAPPPGSGPAHPGDAGDADASRSGRPVRPWGALGDQIWRLAALTLFLVVPLLLIQALALDRAARRAEALADIRALWGGPQVVGGPYVVVPVRGADGGEAAPLVLLVDRLDLDAELATRREQRGVFGLPVYTARLAFNFTLDPSQTASALAPGEEPVWERALLGLTLAEPRTLRGRVQLDTPAGRVDLVPGSGLAGVTGIHAPIGDPRGRAGEWTLALVFGGTEALRVAPAARVTRVEVVGDWPHPDFAGRFRPERAEVSDDGFLARWTIPAVAQGIPEAGRGPTMVRALEAGAFGIALTDPVDLYGAASRTVKFGLLLIALTFAVLFLAGRMASRVPGLAQFAIVGAAQCAFFLLLLSLAERIGLGAAYVIAAAATIALVTVHAWIGLGLGRHAAWLGAAMAALYGAMYLLMVSEAGALLAGAIFIFLALAAAAWGTTVAERGLKGRATNH